MIKNFRIFVNEKYEDILKGYGDEYIKLSKEEGVRANKKTGYFKHITSPILAEKLLIKYYKPGFKLLDIGCGMGNILKLAEEIGYGATGIEINKKLSKYHSELDVVYGDALYMDLSFINKFDIIYLYRPIDSLKKCNILFDKIYNNCKKSCTIIYLLPSQLELNVKKKFQYELFPVMYRTYDPHGPSITYDSGIKTEKTFDDESKTYYSILKPKENIQNIDVVDIINNSIKEMHKYDISKSFRYGSTFKCKNKDFDDFLNCLKISSDMIIKYNINDIKYRYDIEIKEKNTDIRSIGKIPLQGKCESKDIIETLEKNIEIIKNLEKTILSVTVNMEYTKLDGLTYQIINYFGN